jgi:hypothetical protein
VAWALLRDAVHELIWPKPARASTLVLDINAAYKVLVLLERNEALCALVLQLFQAVLAILGFARALALGGTIFGKLDAARGVVPLIETIPAGAGPEHLGANLFQLRDVLLDALTTGAVRARAVAAEHLHCDAAMERLLLDQMLSARPAQFLAMVLDAGVDLIAAHRGAHEGQCRQLRASARARKRWIGR